MNSASLERAGGYDPNKKGDRRLYGSEPHGTRKRLTYRSWGGFANLTEGFFGTRNAQPIYIRELISPS